MAPVIEPLDAGVPPCPEAFHYGVAGLYQIHRPCRLKYESVASIEVGLNPITTHQDVQIDMINRSTLSQAMATIGAGNSSSDSDVDVAFENLYPAIIECFIIILSGYVAGRLNIISRTEAKGLNTFVGTFSLPCLIFMSMATLDFTAVNWHFLLAIFLAKAIVFFAVVIVCLLITRPTDLARSGLYAIFCTQSNDFALGYPIVAALYSKTHPSYPSYLYLVAPISLVVLNPIAFLLMEVGKRKEEINKDLSLESSDLPDNLRKPGKPSTGAIAFKILLNILLNPIVLMTCLGICGNFIFRTCLPVILEGILKVFGSSFSAAALFMLGLRMVGQMHQLKGANLVAPGILISVKCLVLPLVTRELVSVLQAGQNANETTDLANYGFLYGTFPTAPGVFVYSTQFNVDADLVASAMVACTFLSAPLMFISAKMVTLTNLNPANYIGELDSFLFNVSIVGLISTTWVIVIFLLSRKWSKTPHFFTLCLVVSQFLGCLGVLLWSILGCCEEPWQLYLQFVLIALGVFGARLWTALLALSLYFLRTRSLCFVLKLRPYFAAIGWGIPTVVAIVLLSTVSSESLHVAVKSDPNFQYGQTQAVVAVVILISSFLVTLACLILQQRYGRRYNEYQTLNTDGEERSERSPSIASASTTSIRDIEDTFSLFARRESNDSRAGDWADSNSFRPDLETIAEQSQDPETDEGDLLFSPTSDFCQTSTCDPRQQQQCAKLLRRYRARSRSIHQLTEPEEVNIVRDRDDEYQMLRHVVLLLILSCSMFVGIALCVWTIIMEQISGVYLELLFLDGILNFGQGFFVLLIFGFDSRLFVALGKKWRHLRHGSDQVDVVLPRWDRLDPETKHICEQFLSYHVDKCVRDLVRDRRWRLKWYQNVIVGTELVDWLILIGLAHDRSQAVRYGRHLLIGRIIRHIHNEYHFHDQPYFYTFLPSD